MDLKLGVELPLFFVYLSLYIADSVNTNFVIFRTCDVILGYNRSDCEKLGSNNENNSTNELEKLVEPTANIILTTVNLLSHIIPAIYCLFIGPWSDKNGRKTILVVTTFGSLIVFLIKVSVSLIPNASPWLLILECVPIIFTGGTATFLMITLCYITDESSIQNRGMRMAIFECIICLGILVGSLSSSYLLEALGYVGVFLLAAISQLIALILLGFVKESIIDISELQENSSLFTTEHIKDMFKTTVRQRANYGRIILILLIGLLVLFMFAISSYDCFFLFVRAKFEWSLQKYTFYSSISSVIWIFGTFLGVYIMHKILKIPEIILLLIGFIMSCFSSTLQGFAVADWQLYTAVGIASLGGVVTPMVRSLISKEVPADEIGKIFSLTVALESFAMLTAGPIYTFIYNSTIKTFPGLFNLFKSAIYLIEAIIVVIIMVLRRTRSRRTSSSLENIIGED